MTLVVDASIAARWYLQEDGSEQALAVLARDQPLIAPDLVIAEIGSAVWKRVRRREVSTEAAVAIVGAASRAFTSLVSVDELADSAMRLACRFDHPVYDCFYIALGLREEAPIATADRRLAELAERAGAAVEPVGTAVR